MTQKDNPPTQPSKEDLREDHRSDPGGFEDKWGVDPSSPTPPPSQDPGPRRDN